MTELRATSALDYFMTELGEQHGCSGAPPLLSPGGASFFGGRRGSSAPLPLPSMRFVRIGCYVRVRPLTEPARHKPWRKNPGRSPNPGSRPCGQLAPSLRAPLLVLQNRGGCACPLLERHSQRPTCARCRRVQRQDRVVRRRLRASRHRCDRATCSGHRHIQSGRGARDRTPCMLGSFGKLNATIDVQVHPDVLATLLAPAEAAGVMIRDDRDVA
jgi:hypothetical protein